MEPSSPDELINSLLSTTLIYAQGKVTFIQTLAAEI